MTKFGKARSSSLTICLTLIVAAFGWNLLVKPQSAFAQACLPTVALDPNSGPPGTTFAIRGICFSGYSSVSIYLFSWSSATTQALGSTPAAFDGSFLVSAFFSYADPPGIYAVVATDDINGNLNYCGVYAHCARANFTIVQSANNPPSTVTSSTTATTTVTVTNAAPGNTPVASSTTASTLMIVITSQNGPVSSPSQATTTGAPPPSLDSNTTTIVVALIGAVATIGGAFITVRYTRSRKGS